MKSQSTQVGQELAGGGIMVRLHAQREHHEQECTSRIDLLISYVAKVGGDFDVLLEER